MTNIDKIKQIRDITMAPLSKINEALINTNDDVSEAIALLIKQRHTDANDIAHRKSDNNFVYSYIHNNKVGAMIVISSQTDFVAKNELFIQLAKDICIHIVSTPIIPEWISDKNIDDSIIIQYKLSLMEEIKNKPANILEKIVQGKLEKKLSDICLLKQKFVRDENITIQELINTVSNTVGEKIEIKKFVRFSA